MRTNSVNYLHGAATNTTRSDRLLLRSTAGFRLCGRPSLARWQGDLSAMRFRRRHSFIKTRNALWFCHGCNKQFTVKVKTIFEDSLLGWTSGWWRFGCWSTARTGSPEWRFTRPWHYPEVGMVHASTASRLRAQRSFGSQQRWAEPDTELEADETFIGGLTKNMHKDRKLRLVNRAGCMAAKTIVQGT